MTDNQLNRNGVAGNGQLNSRQERFCLNYFTGMSAYRAAKEAGYADTTALVNSCRMLENTRIQQRIQELQQKAEDESVASVLERKQRLTEILRANITDYVSEAGIKVDNNSHNIGAISEITTKTKIFRKTGEAYNITNLKLHNPIPAIAEINKMENVYQEGTTLNVDNRRQYIINVPSEQGKSNIKRVMNGERT